MPFKSKCHPVGVHDQAWHKGLDHIEAVLDGVKQMRAVFIREAPNAAFEK